jgi:transcriptional regulator with XRE-family HTH domain
MLVADIARLSGVCRSLVGAIISGRKQRISQKTEDAILGVPMPDNDLSANRNGLVDATGARRRLQALAIQGFSVSFLAGRTSLSHLTVEEVRSGVRLQVTGAVNRKIADVCETYWNADPLACGLSKAPVERTRRWAREKNWIPLAAWDEETISDPQAHPNHLLSETPRYVVLVENTQELMEQQGYTLEQAADRQGVTVNAIQKARARYRENVTKAS